MQELLVISGKGGTGKTSLVASFAALAQNKVLADCDVDAADLHLLLEPQKEKINKFYGSKKAVINSDKCINCGRCLRLCRFDAIKNNENSYRVNPIYCEGCGVCEFSCPVNAINMKPNLSGYWYISKSTYGPMVHAQLGIAEDNSGKLVTVVRQAARELAEQEGLELIIADGPPGIGCPVISSMTAVSLALVVTEPTVAGWHDMERVIQLAKHFNVPVTVCINKYDLDMQKSQQIEEYCLKQGIEVVGKIPFDEGVAQALAGAKPITVASNGKAAKAIKSIWSNLYARLKNKTN
ncbi:MAG: hypothetical protein PWP31_893 [Clostridia bacterium]|nr:hypothetical protein [Clostridia bacterium]